MRSKSMELMEQISNYIGDYYRQHHSTPTTREIATAVGISPASGYNYLVEMDKRGMLSYENGEITDLPKITKTQTGYFSAPLVGSIRCGDPETEEAQVVGDSMEDENISDGDLVLIKKQPDCEVGDIVVALDENNENTLKVYGGIDKRSKKVILKYANEKVYPGKRILVNELVVQGVAKHVIKEL